MILGYSNCTCFSRPAEGMTFPLACVYLADVSKGIALV
ncbi:hypothetical protein RRG08_059580, partial [Elysia crispata]